jgi:alpha-mannosidase
MKFTPTKLLDENLQKLLTNLEQMIYQPISDLEITAWKTKEPVKFKDRKNGSRVVLKKGSNWGELFDCAWFHITGKVPEQGIGKNIVMIIDLSGEACVFNNKGEPLQGLTTFSSLYDFRLGAPGKRIVSCTDEAKYEEQIEIWLDAGNNDLFGNLKNNGTIQEACIAICNTELRQLYYDFEVLYELTKQLDEKSARYEQIIYALYLASLKLNEFTSEEVIAARKILAPELNKRNGDSSLLVSAIGHAHIDLAWLWPIRETIRKGARTYSNVLMLMDKYPDFKFGASQPQLYQWIKENYSTLYDRIKVKIEEKRWEIFGGTWVEIDTNLPGSEALVRQFLYAKDFYKKEFNIDKNYLFLPDTFGYSGALPQIMKKSRIDYFLTIKLSWDEFNSYPHHTFIWQGIDSSNVLVHMPPEATYNSSAAPRAVKKAENDYLDKAVSDHCLMLYGIGDGGGGPGEEHLERLKREKNLAGVAPVKQEFISDFLKQLEKDRNKFHIWKGELYLGRHQGTLTTHGLIKKFNRKMELALHDTEFISVIAAMHSEHLYKSVEIEKIWKEVLLYQFHDILTGDSITRVFNEAYERYHLLLNKTKTLTKSAIEDITASIDTSNFHQPALIINTLSWQRNEWIKINGNWYNAELPPMGYKTIESSNIKSSYPERIINKQQLENDILKLELSEEGTIFSIFDKVNNREILESGKSANQLTVYHDDGDAFDFCLDYSIQIAGSFELISTDSYYDGPKGIIKQVRKFGRSTLIQNIILTEGSRRIDFETFVDWHESNKMLRSSFPVNIYSNEATSEIQFGYIKRSTHDNTSWDIGKYETSAHKWIDLSERDYGVALLNDSKYGYKLKNNILDINLLRSTHWPDPVADIGEHEFIYSLFPHGGDHISGEVAQAGYELNIPLMSTIVKSHTGNIPSYFSLVQVKNNSIIIESIKKAQNNSDLIIRLYEANGKSEITDIKFNFKIEKVYLANLMEENIKTLTISKNILSIPFNAFEIHTLRVKLTKNE